MKKTLGVVAAAAMAAMPMVGVLAEGELQPSVSSDTATTELSATVGKLVGCQSGNATIATTITPGQAGSATFDLEGNSNSTAGFTIKSGTMGNLTNDKSDTIAYNSSAAATVQGWKISAEGADFGISDNVATWATTTDGYAKKTVTFTVGTGVDTPSGTYEGSISWTCNANPVGN